jgi:glycine/serine hydroxymethyltransferase
MIGQIIGDVLAELSKSKDNNETAEAVARDKVKDLCRNFPIYQGF